MKEFPILQGKTVRSIPWDMIAPHYKQAEANHYQRLTRLAERGGLSSDEALCVLKDKRWDGPTFVMPEQRAERDAYHAKAEVELAALVKKWTEENT